MQRLIVHFKAQNCWLADVKVGFDKESARFSVETHLEGDHTRESPTNSWAMPLIPVNANSQPVFLALTVHFNGRSPRDGMSHPATFRRDPETFS